MNKKLLIIGIIVAAGILFILLFFNFRAQCHDGQGFALYIPKDTLMDNLANADTSQIRDGWIPPTIFDYTARTETNSCGFVSNNVIVENGKELKVSMKKFDKFVADYNTQCGYCLLQVSQGGNSRLFVKEISSGKSFMVGNINGTLILKEVLHKD